MRLDVEYLEYMWPMRHFLITTGEMEGRSNIIALSFVMPVSKEPPLLACAISRDAYSSSLIKSTGEFAVNVPGSGLKGKIYFCGSHTGYKLDKFKETGLTPKSARSIKAPVIDECVAFMECRLIKDVETGDKTLFIGRVLEAYADEVIVKGNTKMEYAGGDFPRKVYSTRFR